MAIARSLHAAHYLVMNTIDETDDPGSPEQIDDEPGGVWICKHCGYHHMLVAADEAFPETCPKCGISAGLVAI